MGFLRVLLLLILDLVMTEPTGKEFLAARGQEEGSAFVVGTLRHL